MRNAQEYFPGLSVSLCYVSFQGFSKAFVTGLVTLDDFSGSLVEDKDMVVLVEYPGGDVSEFFGFKSSVLHARPLLLDGDEGEGRLSFAAELAVDLEFCRAEEELAAPVVQACCDFAKVSRPHCVLEADLVDPCI